MKFAEDTLIPYLERQIKFERQAIKEVNIAALKIRFACEVCNMTFETKVKLKTHFTGHLRSNPTATRRRSRQGGSGGMDIGKCQELLIGSLIQEVENNQYVVAALVEEVVEISSSPTKSGSPSQMDEQLVSSSRLDGQSDSPSRLERQSDSPSTGLDELPDSPSRMDGQHDSHWMDGKPDSPSRLDGQHDSPTMTDGQLDSHTWLDGKPDSPSLLNGRQPTQLLALMPPQELTSKDKACKNINLSKSQVLPAFNFMLDVYDEDVHLATAGQQIATSLLTGNRETVVPTSFLAHNEKLEFNFSPIIPSLGKKSLPSKNTEKQPAIRLEDQAIEQHVENEGYSYKCMSCQEDCDSDETLERQILRKRPHQVLLMRQVPFQ